MASHSVVRRNKGRDVEPSQEESSSSSTGDSWSEHMCKSSSEHSGQSVAAEAAHPTMSLSSLEATAAEEIAGEPELPGTSPAASAGAASASSNVSSHALKADRVPLKLTEPRLWPRTMSFEGTEALDMSPLSIASPAVRMEFWPRTMSRDDFEAMFHAGAETVLPAREHKDLSTELRVVSLASAIPSDPALGTPALPTVGSRSHFQGTCRPCAFLHTRGCQNGIECPFCHLCSKGEKKRRQRERWHQQQQQRKFQEQLEHKKLAQQRSALGGFAHGQVLGGGVGAASLPTAVQVSLPVSLGPVAVSWAGIACHARHNFAAFCM